MKSELFRKRWLLMLIPIILLLTTLTLAAAPQINLGNYGLAWAAATSSGPASNGGTYQLNGSSGQAAADLSSGGIYQLNSGFWSGAGLPEYTIFLPLVSSP